MQRFATPMLWSSLRAKTSREGVRLCSSGAGAGIPDIAPKREKKRTSTGTAPLSEAALKPNVASASELPAPGKAEAEEHMEGAQMKRQMDEIAKMDPAKLEELLGKFNEAEDAEARVLANDSLYQLDVSMKMHYQGGVRVFWKDVDVVHSTTKGWFHVAVDGRKVKAFETKAQLIVPGEDFAYAIAAEWGKQKNHLNKLSMPLTDLASGAQHVSPQMIAPRIDYLMSFFPNDNCYFRQEAIQEKQDQLLERASEWYSRVFDFDIPRVVGIAHPHPDKQAQKRVREYLHAQNFNQYQIVAMCVLAQTCASIMLPLAMVARVTSVKDALDFARAEEAHNISSEGSIAGYHDIRDADQIVKMAAAINGYRLGSTVSLKECSEAMMSVATADPDLEELN